MKKTTTQKKRNAKSAKDVIAMLLGVGKTRDRGLLSDVRAAIAKANGRAP